MVKHSYPPDSPPVAKSGTSCNSSLYNSSSSFIFIGVFGFYAVPSDKFHHNFSPIISLLFVAGLSVLITVSSDEDVEEIGEDEREELVDRPRTTNGT